MTRKGLSVSPVYKALIKAVIVLTDHTCVRKMTHRLIEELYTGSISTLGQSYKVHVHTSIVDFNWWQKKLNTLKFYSKHWLGKQPFIQYFIGNLFIHYTYMYPHLNLVWTNPRKSNVFHWFDHSQAHYHVKDVKYKPYPIDAMLILFNG